MSVTPAPLRSLDPADTPAKAPRRPVATALPHGTHRATLEAAGGCFRSSSCPLSAERKADPPTATQSFTAACVLPPAFTMVAQHDGRSLACMADVFGGMIMCNGRNPPFLAVDIFQLGKGVALVGIESMVCCAAWDKHSDLRLSLGC